MSEARDILTTAIARGDRREAARPRIDYAGVKVAFRRQKSALTRAKNSGDPERVIIACRDAVREWGRPPFSGAWPDDWSRWQRALDDVLPWSQLVRLEDLEP